MTPELQTPLQDSTTERPIRVLVADDHDTLRCALKAVVSSDPAMEWVGEARDGVEAVEMALELDPDVVVMDISMPRMNGVEATRRITSERESIQVIGLSMFEEREQERAMMQAGGKAYMVKGADSGAIIAKIRELRQTSDG